ncbi:VOC family protein [Pseudofrankia sp. BMG5.37]|uniref:VOC family protein n=1 Tax=Pseudofrankia sp. BMG5.37 TaxID=3050035 RepID=UPI0028955E92|nr:VOC family protein [Pseudofrankia sp. BMG5.37]MDT3443898.1 VOC family protein [Pseudofrankia sp. BMG5.37]
MSLDTTTNATDASHPAQGSTLQPGDITGVLVAMLPVSDLAVSVAWYRDLLGMHYRREFSRDGVVTGCALGSDAGFAISFRLRSTTAGTADLRGEHPIILNVPDPDALARIRAHAERLGYNPVAGEHADGTWVEVIDPDGISTRFIHGTGDWSRFTGVAFHPGGEATFYPSPRLILTAPRR